MTDRDSLLRAVAAHPDDDLSRLVYADWCEENGDPDRAAFIRAQVEFARHWREGEGLNPHARRLVLDGWAEHQQRWRAELPDIPGVLWDVVFHRGFVERASVNFDATAVYWADELFGRTPLLHLCVQRFAGATGFARCEPLRHLKTCRIAIPADAAADAAEELLACGEMRDDLVLFLSVSGESARRERDIRAKFGGRLFAPHFAQVTTTRRANGRRQPAGGSRPPQPPAG